MLPEYAYRAIDADGSPVRAAFPAEDPEKVVLRAREAGHHVVMVYRLESEPEPHYERLMEAPNFLPPPVLARKVDFVRALCSKRDLKAIRAAIRDGTLEGNTGWFRTAVRTASLLELGMNALSRRIFEEGLLAFAEHGGEPPSLPEGPRQVETSEHERARFFSVPLVEAGDDFEPSRRIRGLVSDGLAFRHQVVPYSLEGGRLTLIAGRPHDQQTADDLRFNLGTDVALVRCSEDPEENWRIVTGIVVRVYPGSFEKMMQVITRSSGRPVEKEQFEAWEEGLPPLPVEREGPALSSRTDGLLSVVAELAFEPEAWTSPLVRLCYLLVMAAGKDGWTGMRLPPDRDEGAPELFRGDMVFRMGPLPPRLREAAVLLLSAAVGIEPATLPPASSQVELEFEGRSFTVTGETRFADRGQGVEVRWSM